MIEQAYDVRAEPSNVLPGSVSGPLRNDLSVGSPEPASSVTTTMIFLIWRHQSKVDDVWINPGSTKARMLLYV